MTSMASDDPRRPDDPDDSGRPQDRSTEPIPRVRPESANEYDELNETAEFLPPEIGEEELIGLRGGSGLPIGPRSAVSCADKYQSGKSD